MKGSGGGRRWRVQGGCRDAQAGTTRSVHGRRGQTNLLQLFHHHLDRQRIPATRPHAATVSAPRLIDCAWPAQAASGSANGAGGAGAGARQLSVRSSASTAGSSRSPSASDMALCPRARCKERTATSSPSRPFKRHVYGAFLLVMNHEPRVNHRTPARSSTSLTSV